MLTKVCGHIAQPVLVFHVLTQKKPSPQEDFNTTMATLFLNKDKESFKLRNWVKRKGWGV
jgi:hypothetical protein